MDNFEKYITTQVQNDELNFTADKGIQERLMYHMQLKSASSNVRKNQFLPSFSVLIASKFIAWKLGIATILIASFMGYNQFQQESKYTIASDTTQILNAIDTTNILIKDSIVRY